MPKNIEPQKAKRLEPIKQAIMLEMHGVRFYRVAAERCSNPKVREMFTDLAEDEVRHRAELERQFKSILREGHWSPPPSPSHKDLRFRDPVIDVSLKKDIDGAWFDSAALSIGTMLERRALDYYSEKARSEKDPGVRALFQWLAQWEEGHLERLLALERAIREEIWNEADFWPLD